MRRVFLGAVTTVFLSGTAMADSIRVAADIAPVHSLVSRVMQGAGSPELLIRAGETPHDFALRPSTAKTLQEAEVVFWVGSVLTPSLERTLETLAVEAKSVELAKAKGATVLEFREDAVFEEDDEHHDEDKHEHSEDDHDEDEHDHHGNDPHMWLDPQNAIVWLDVIAASLAAAQPENADLFEKNAQMAKQELRALEAEIIQKLQPAKSLGFVVFHDAYQYFENRFDLKSAGAIIVADGRAPSAARLEHLREAMSHQNITCVFSEPQFDPRVIQAVSEKGIKTAELDPMGVSLEPGPNLYPALMQNMAAAIAGCNKK